MGEAARKKRGEFPKPAAVPQKPAPFPGPGQHLRLSQITMVAAFDVVRDSDGKRVSGLVTPGGGPKPEDQPLVMAEAETPEAMLLWLREKMARAGIKV